MTKAPELTREQRAWFHQTTYCDACPARAVYRVIFTFGELDFCNHHYTKNDFELACKAVHTLSRLDENGEESE
jgi:hypothetical protein